MRLAAFLICVVVGATLLVLALPNFVASLIKAPGQQAIDFAQTGADIHERSFERAASGLRAAMLFRERKADFADLVVIHENLGRQQVGNLPLRDRLYAEGLATFEQSARLSPVDPSGWLLVAQMRYELGEREAAAEALAWSLRTSVYRTQQAMPRAFLGLGVWDLLDEETLTRLDHSIETTFRQAPDSFVAWVDELGLAAEIEARLTAWHAASLAASEAAADAVVEDEALPVFGPPAPTVAERFADAVARHRLERQAALEAQREIRAMRQAFLASSLLLAASLPLPAPAMTVADYMDIRDNSHDPLAEARLNDYLVGVLDGLVMLGSLSRSMEGAFFCMPDEAVVEIHVQSFRRELDIMLEQLADEIVGFSELARTRTVGLAALQLLTERYPCDGAVGRR